MKENTSSKVKRKNTRISGVSIEQAKMAARRPPGSPGKIISFFRDSLLGVCEP